MTCLHCTRAAEYDSPDPLCAEHWLAWWVANFQDGTFTPEQVATIERETREVMIESGVQFESPLEMALKNLAERSAN